MKDPPTSGSAHAASMPRDQSQQCSDAAEGDHDTDLPRCFPRNCRGHPVFYGNQEALAWAIDNSVTIVTFVGTGAFLGTALLKLAKDAAGCEVDPPEGETVVPDCEKRIYGIKPSSLLSTMGTIVDVFSASLMPICGAIVDTTPYRRRLGRILVTFFCTFVLVSIFVSEQTWFAIAILQIIWGFFVWFQSMITYSYLPDLTTDETVMREYTKAFAVLSYCSMIVYMALITGARAGMGYLDEDKNKGSLEDEIQTAQLSQSVSFAACTIGLSIAWGLLFGERPALRSLSEDQSIWTAGFRQVAKTVVQIYKKHTRLKWFYLSIMFCDPAIMALTILSITFLTDQLQFSAKENGTAMLVMMLCAVPGSYVGSWFTKKFDAVVSSLVAIAVLIATTVTVAIILKGPDQQTETYLLAGGWGLGTGWKWMCDRMVLLSVLPPGQNAELMGVYVFFRQVIAWLPKLVFTVLNERDISQRIGMATLNIYFVVAFGALCRLLMVQQQTAATEAQAVGDDEAGAVSQKSEEHDPETVIEEQAAGETGKQDRGRMEKMDL